MRSGLLLGISSFLMIFSLPEWSVAQDFSRSEVGCVSAVHKEVRKFLRTVGKENATCLKLAGKDRLPEDTTVDGCLEGDLKGKVAKALNRLVVVQDGKNANRSGARCPEVRPVAGFVEFEDFSEALRKKADQWAVSVAGAHDNRLATVLLDLTRSDKKAAGVCQKAVVTGANKVLEEGFAQYSACIEEMLETWEATVEEPAPPLAECFARAVEADEGGKIEKARRKLESQVRRKCAAGTAELAEVVPGSCGLRARDATQFSHCTVDTARMALGSIASIVTGIGEPGRSARLSTEILSHITVAETQNVGRLIGFGNTLSVPLASSPDPAKPFSAGGDRLHGTDLGVPVSARVDSEDRLYFLFGDSDYTNPTSLQAGQVVKREPDSSGPTRWVLEGGVVGGDIVGYTTDSDPDDGISLDHVLRNVEAGGAPVCTQLNDANDLRTIAVPGIHDNPDHYAREPELGGDFCFADKLNSTPTGAFASRSVIYSLLAVQNADPDWDPDEQGFDSESFLAASTDGARTWSVMNAGNPLSSTVGGQVPKFFHLDAVPIDVGAYQDPFWSSPCPLPMPDAGGSRDAFLLFGTGTWLQSDVFLGLVFADDLETSRTDSSAPLNIHYFVGPRPGDCPEGSGPGDTDCCPPASESRSSSCERCDFETSCWKENVPCAAMPVIEASSGLAILPFHSACPDHAIGDRMGGFGHISVVHLDGEVDGTRAERLLLAGQPGYATCPNPADGEGGCCLGTRSPENPRICARPPPGTIPPNGTFLDSSLGTGLVSGDPYRPWEWTQNLDGAPELALLPQATGYPDRVGARCPAGVGFDLLGGYGPHMIDPFTRATASGDGFEIFVNNSAGRNLFDPSSSTPEYAVDVSRFTVRPAGTP